MGDDDVWARMFQRARGGEPDSSTTNQKKRTEAQGTKAKAALDGWLKKPAAGAPRAPAVEFHRQLSEPDGGVIRVDNFLPADVAEGMLQALEGALPGSWSMTEDKDDVGRKEDGAGSVRHKYNVGDGTLEGASSSTGAETEAAAAIAGLQRAMQSLFPDATCSFQAGRYTRGCFIEPHDDVAFKDLEDATTGVVTRQARDIAVIYYLTKDWEEEMGGIFVDMEAGVQHVPKFNSLVAFKVPRLHMVTSLHTDRSRFSMFGWFYKPTHAADSAQLPAKADKKRKKTAKNTKNTKNMKRETNADDPESSLLAITPALQKKKNKKTKKNKGGKVDRLAKFD
mmetsp:Transcript_28335/g.47543  ORF Transcript_28335/g.47543 Transcript_28335/m.47543 type:complete len:338 (+) Transcript_28335:236-1249(+)|eukprot:CAMPEP_0198216794 /NCGR_PEP_ID=MMETSP1445-20131203/59714_1 /TAXON_ID=36898 /ORGANISM="Pyramimonas sp., Strain CCMP2087" /LENGTH=337 /DNA_ID=CAMNT_0043893203 /DNA_START=167 /DNA_END=1180 /DNA_ORIENTATION=-